MKIRRQRKHRSRAQRREKRLREGRLWYLTDEEDGRALALDPNTPSETLFQLAAFFPKEVRRNPSTMLHALDDPQRWADRFETLHKLTAGALQGQPPKDRRSLENCMKTSVMRRYARRSSKRVAYWTQRAKAKAEAFLAVCMPIDPSPHEQP